MRQTNRILPVYSGDVSGACSALFEMGGMVVIHDPSGCYSTYDTHDETRWYDTDSLIFLTGLTERDAMLGNDKKLIEDTAQAAALYHPRFIALCNSPIPYLNGTDFAGVCRVLEKRTGVPVFHVRTNGMHDYVQGVSQAFAQLAETVLVEEAVTAESTSFAGGPLKVNVLGMTPLDFAAPGAAEALEDKLEKASLRLHACWGMGRGVQSIGASGRADVNLAVSSSGEGAARVLRERFGTPAVFGVPCGAFSEKLLSETKKAAGDRPGQFTVPFLEVPENAAARRTVVLIGEPVVMGSLAAALRMESGGSIKTVVAAATENSAPFIRKDRDFSFFGEEELAKRLRVLAREADSRGERIAVAADPLYRPVCPESAELFPVPHLAFSGRIFLDRIPNLFGEDCASIMGGKWI